MSKQNDRRQLPHGSPRADTHRGRSHSLYEAFVTIPGPISCILKTILIEHNRQHNFHFFFNEECMQQQINHRTCNAVVQTSYTHSIMLKVVGDTCVLHET